MTYNTNNIKDAQSLVGHSHVLIAGNNPVAASNFTKSQAGCNFDGGQNGTENDEKRRDCKGIAEETSTHFQLWRQSPRLDGYVSQR